MTVNSGSNSRSSWVLAIDFGTSSTTAAIGRDGGAELVAVDGGLARMLSNVFLQESSGKLLLGELADNASTLAPWCFERSPKVKLGQEYMLLGNKRVSVTDAVGQVLRRVTIDAVRMRGGEQPALVRLTHPVRWGDEKRAALLEAARSAGLENLELMLEPVAAARHYARERLATGDHVAVYDLGGGTLDTAVLQRTETGFEVIGEPRGRDGFGGEDFDHRLYRYLGTQLPTDDWVRLRADPDQAGDTTWSKANRQFQRNVHRAKELLTHNDEVDVEVPAPLARTLHLTRHELEDLIRVDIRDSVDELAISIESASLRPTDLVAIYLAGGSSQIPLVADVITRQLNVEPQHLNDSKAVICLGAALGDLPPVSRDSTRDRVGDKTVPTYGATEVERPASQRPDASPTTGQESALVRPPSAGALDRTEVEWPVVPSDQLEDEPTPAPRKPAPATEPSRPAHTAAAAARADEPDGSTFPPLPAAHRASSQRPALKRRLLRYGLPAAALVAVAIIVVVVFALHSSTSPAGQTQGAALAGVPDNRVTGNGAVSVTLHGDVATVTVKTHGLLNNAPHLMHIHAGKRGVCPPAAAARLHNGHLSISTGDGIGYYGATVATFSTFGSTSGVFPNNVKFDAAPIGGNINYKRTFVLTKDAARLIRLGDAVVVVHGIDYNANHQYDDVLGVSDLDHNYPGEATAPALCGPLRPQNSSALPSSNSQASVYTAHFGAVRYFALTRVGGKLVWVCHVGALPAASLNPGRTSILGDRSGSA